jgi:hypothetical protein
LTVHPHHLPATTAAPGKDARVSQLQAVRIGAVKIDSASPLLRQCLKMLLDGAGKPALHFRHELLRV